MKVQPLGRLRLASSPHDKDLHWRFLFHAVFDVLQPAVVPAQAKLQTVDRGCRPEIRLPVRRTGVLAVNPRAQDHLLGGLLGLRQCHITHGRLARPGIVPAADQIHRNVFVVLNLIDDAKPRLLPIGVVFPVAHGPHQPLFVFGGQADRGHPLAQREAEQILAQILSCFFEDRARSGVSRGTAARGRADGEDPVHEAQLEGAAVAHAEITGVCHRVGGDHGLEAGRARQGERMLRASGIRSPDRGEAAIAPRLRDNPLRRVVTIGRVVGHHVPDPLGVVPATSVLSDGHITAARIIRPPAFASAVFVVRRPLEHGWELSLQTHSIACREIKVRRQPHAVPHGNHDVLFDHIGAGINCRSLRSGAGQADRAENKARYPRAFHSSPPERFEDRLPRFLFPILRVFAF